MFLAAHKSFKNGESTDFIKVNPDEDHSCKKVHSLGVGDIRVELGVCHEYVVQGVLAGGDQIWVELFISAVGKGSRNVHPNLSDKLSLLHFQRSLQIRIKRLIRRSKWVLTNSKQQWPDIFTILMQAFPILHQHFLQVLVHPLPINNRYAIFLLNFLLVLYLRLGQLLCMAPLLTHGLKNRQIRSLVTNCLKSLPIIDCNFVAVRTALCLRNLTII